MMPNIHQRENRICLKLYDNGQAEYCLHRETAQVLFEKDLNDWPIRALVLSNQALAKASFRGFPECLFGSEEGVLTYLSTVSLDEQAILFSNPSIYDGFLESFLTLGKPWEVMDQDQRLWALVNLASNGKLRHKRSSADYDDGYDHYLAGKPFAAAWALIENLEPNAKEAKHLGALLRDLPADSFETDGIFEALKSWCSRPEDVAKEIENNAKGRLSDFQIVRQAGARLLASRYDGEPGQFLKSEDIALRCGAYEGERKLDNAKISEAIERDKDLARVHLVRNDDLWRREKTRDILLDVVLRGSETDEPQWEYRAREQRYRKEFPSWFEGEQYPESDERPIAESSIADVVAGVAGDPSVKGIQERLVAVEKAQQTLLWLVGIILLLIVLQIWT
jgi:hypothetical protein